MKLSSALLTLTAALIFTGHLSAQELHNPLRIPSRQNSISVFTGAHRLPASLPRSPLHAPSLATLNEPLIIASAAAAGAGEWTWMSGSSSVRVNCNRFGNCGPAGVYGALGTAAAGNTPGGRFGASSWTDNSGNLWLFGGDGFDGSGNLGILNDLWEFNPGTNEWTWQGGNSTVGTNCALLGYCGRAGAYGKLGVPAPGNLPGSRSDGAIWTDSSGHFWLFGGYGYDANGSLGDLNDLWEFDPSTNQWAWMSGSNVLPPQDDGQPGVYGVLGTPASGNVPGGRLYSMSWVDTGGNLWLFGGLGFDADDNLGDLNDLWEFNPSTKLWAWMGGSSTIGNVCGFEDNNCGRPGVYGVLGTPAAGNIPGGRKSADAWTDSSGTFWLFGGLGFDSQGGWSALNDLWQFNPSTKLWTWIGGSSTIARNGGGQPTMYGDLGVPAAGNNPGGHYQSAHWIDGNNDLWLYAGISSSMLDSGTDSDDLWEFNPATGEWTWWGGQSLAYTPAVYGTLGVPAPTNFPGAREDAAAWTDRNGNGWVFAGGGYDAGDNPGFLNDLWSYQAAATLPVTATPTFNPPAGIYVTPQAVTISDTTPGAVIYFTIDGSTPTINSSVYNGPIAVAAPQTVQAIAVAPGYAPSAVASAAYSIGVATTTVLVASPTTLPVGQTLTLTATVATNLGITPAGTVTFLNGTAILGSAPLNSSGVATLTLTPALGLYSIVASYGGTPATAASVSLPVLVLVTPDTSTFPDIYTFAGAGVNGFGGDGGLATNAWIGGIWDQVVDGLGNVYIGDTNNGRIRRVDATTGIITTIAGNGLQGFSGDGGPATSAELFGPHGVALDPFGNLYFADWGNSEVRKVNLATGIITRVAGLGSGGDGGLATNASLNLPQAVATDAKGNIFIADTGDDRIRRVDALTNIITTVAGNGTQGYNGDGILATNAELFLPSGVALDSSGNIFIADQGNNRIRRVDAVTGIITTVAGNGIGSYAGDGGPATSAELWAPVGILPDAAGNLYIGDYLNNRVRMVDAATGVIITFAGDGIPGYSGDGGPSNFAEVLGPAGLAFDGKGNLYIADRVNNRVRIVGQQPQYLIATTTVLTASSISLTPGQSLTLTATVTAASGPTPSGTVTFYNGTMSLGAGALNAAGIATLTLTPAMGSYSITASYGGSTTDGASVSSPPITVTASAAEVGTNTNLTATPAQLDVGQTLTLTATVTSPSGGIPTGTVTFMSGPKTLGSGPLNANGAATVLLTPFVGNYSIVASYGGDAAHLSSSSTAQPVAVVSPDIFTYVGDGVRGFTGDGGPATSAEISAAWGLAFDAAGNLYIADGGNNDVRKVIAATGIIETVAGNQTLGYGGDGGPATSAELNAPWGLAVDRLGNLFIADSQNSRIRRVDALTGVITTVAGNGVRGYGGDAGPATAAELSAASGVVVDPAGNLYIADQGNDRIRMVAASTGIITTIAGNGSHGYAGDGGPAINAEFRFPQTIAIDSAGNLFVTDLDNFVVREISAATGVIATVAGNGVQAGNLGDGGPATSAEFNEPVGIAVDAADNLYITDSETNLVREVDAATGIIVTVAGTGGYAYGGDGGPAIDAVFEGPEGVGLDPAGNLFIGDTGNARVRVLSAAPQIPLIPTNTTLSASANTLTFGQPLTLTATVTPTSGSTPTGTVTFYNGSTSLGSAPLNASGVATLTLTPAIGTYSFTAGYGGSATDAQSTSAPPISVTVAASSTTTTLASSAIPLTFGQTLTLTATVIAASGPTPTGTVTFYNGTTSLGAAPLNASGVAVLTLTPAAGSYSITASYGGSATDTASASSPPILVTVYPVSTITALTASPNPAAFGANVTFTATVSSVVPTPTGGVTFYDGATPLATVQLNSGVATFSTTTLSVGSHNITAQYASVSNYAPSTSNTVIEVIDAADFAISAAPPSATLYTGQSASFTVTITPGTGFNLPVSLTCPNLPANTICTFSSSTIPAGAVSSNLIVQTSAPAPVTSASGFSSGYRIATLAGLVLLLVPKGLRRRSLFTSLLLLCSLLAGAAAVTSCGAPGPLSGGTPLGAQSITIAGAATNGSQTLNHSTTVTLNVKSLF
jgi:N-acetylneuraminic acid mutarotase